MFPIKIMIQIQNHVHKKSASILCKYRLRETKEKGEEGTKICKYMEEKKHNSPEIVGKSVPVPFRRTRRR
ncbi:hypothetical protein HanRHA438_Chr12g0534111 [Helianthus annuus]|uniref:Uncharacterized protein n=1 Tax=Helianthus annuus TaxID=4232 RepID=A0A9K3IVP1_HELAN|nr:hypothetical protein HanXRQr2_Chr05g0192791 [Helianthus annuus]KAJ0491355.1 hypothetical protein HanIR_Chr12g0562931 [Helianthus annuus]KAJ0864833.1 hypothetical protein HanRHA438_Chr12g0534111 [Helianthus annuus]